MRSIHQKFWGGEKTNKKIALFSILTISMLMLPSLLDVAYAGKPVGAAHIELVSASTYLQVNVYNDGGIAITGVEITITVGSIPSANFYGTAGWSVLRSNNHALYETSGRTVIRKDQVSPCGGFNCNPLVSYTMDWRVLDRKGQTIDSGTYVWTP